MAAAIDSPARDLSLLALVVAETADTGSHCIACAAGEGTIISLKPASVKHARAHSVVTVPQLISRYSGIPVHQQRLPRLLQWACVNI